MSLGDPKSKENAKTVHKLYYKVWSGLTKFIRSQVTQQRCVYFSLLGSFTTLAAINGSSTEKDKETFVYIPDVAFLDKGKFKYSDDDYNKNPYADIKIK